jgi:hypothetical protein
VGWPAGCPSGRPRCRRSAPRRWARRGGTTPRHGLIGARHRLPAVVGGTPATGLCTLRSGWTHGTRTARIAPRGTPRSCSWLPAACRGSISGEHGFGFVRRGHLDQQWSGAAVDLHHGIKRAFDPHDLMNPGKKI